MEPVKTSDAIRETLDGARLNRDGRAAEGRLWALVVTALEEALLRALVAEGVVDL